ncbi:ompA family protein [Asticcacaulis biprosthecium C19]|uniref:OmpA family protein n=1 Tax=Asticcacaulis biprosthecium C19 TaxID=715226 RepID=F4QMB7_9CAUL|nr:ompA family protein [Asticcacaulis biprosthecium C19]
MALALPRRAEGLETMLRSQVEQRLAAQGLGGFEVRMDGQATTLAYRDDGFGQTAASGESARDRMLRAVAVARGVTGGLPESQIYGSLLMGPVTRVRMDEGSVDLMQARLDGAATQTAVTEQVLQAAEDCTDRVTAAVADRRLQFISGSAELTGDSQAILIDIYNTIQTCPQNLALSVEGYTDNVGQDNDNMKLSTARAEAAAFALIDLGLAQASVSSRGYGAQNPIADNTSEDGRARNRRVDFILRPRDEPEGP